MKTTIFSFILLLISSFFIQSAQAQTDNHATFEAYLKTVYGAFEKGGFDALSKYYAPNASEISPDGTQLNGLSAIRANWTEAEKIFDAKPQFEYKLTTSRLLAPNIALINWDATDKFSMQGQKMEFHSTASAVLRKENGQWLIEFSQLTPKMNFEMPDQQADIAAINALGKEAYAAFGARDAARFAACYAEDVDFVSPYGMHIKGRKAVEQVHAELFKSWANMPKEKIEVGDPNVRFLGPDVAVCQWSHKETIAMDGKMTVQEATFLDVCHKVDGKWLVTGFAITPVMPIPGMEAAKN